MDKKEKQKFFSSFMNKWIISFCIQTFMIWSTVLLRQQYGISFYVTESVLFKTDLFLILCNILSYFYMVIVYDNQPDICLLEKAEKRVSNAQILVTIIQLTFKLALIILAKNHNFIDYIISGPIATFMGYVFYKKIILFLSGSE